MAGQFPGKILVETLRQFTEDNINNGRLGAVREFPWFRGQNYHDNLLNNSNLIKNQNFIFKIIGIFFCLASETLIVKNRNILK